MARRKVSTTIYLEPWQLDALHTLRTETQLTVTHHISVAITNYLEEHIPYEKLNDIKAKTTHTVREEISSLETRIQELKARLGTKDPGGEHE